MLLAEGAVTIADDCILGAKDKKGSLNSPDGDVRGVGSVDGIELLLPARRLVEVCRFDLADDGDASRERVLRKFDLRLGGGIGRVSTFIGRSGILKLGYESRSL